LKSKFNYFYLITIFGIFSCENSTTLEGKYMTVSSKNAFLINHSQWDSLELLVPQIGCNSCIDLLIDKYKEYNIEIKLSMIGVNRERDLRLNYGNEFVDNSNIKIFADLIHKPIAEDCFGLPSLLFYNGGNIRYFCFKADEVEAVISYLSQNE
jgi:hypothetical protein